MEEVVMMDTNSSSIANTSFPTYRGPADPNRKVFVIIKLTECTLGVILHALGLLALTSSRKKSNQTILLISLTSSNLLFLTMTSSLCMSMVFGIRVTHMISTISDTVIMMAILEIVFLVYILTFDRLIGVVFPLRHKFYLSKYRVRLLIIVSWCFSAWLVTL